MKKQTTWWWILGLLAVAVGLVGWSWALKGSDPEVVARSGMHWHPQLAIYQNGEPVEIPANIGIGAVHQPIHTHTEDAARGIIHLEFDGAVRRDDIRLGNFFRNWDKDIMTAFGTLTRMTVNGEDSRAYGDYIMQNDDVIELFYESSTSTDAELAE